MITTADFRDRFIPKAVEYIDTEQKNRFKEAQYKRVFKVISSDTQYVDTRQKESMGPLKMTAEGAELDELTQGDGFPKRITQVKWAGKVVYPMEVKLFELVELAADLTKNLALACPHLMEVIAAAFIEKGFTAIASIPNINGVPMVDSICGDGNTIFHATHGFKSDGSRNYANKNASAFVSMDQTSVQNMNNTILRWTSSTGSYLDIRPKTLMGPVEKRQTMRELCLSPLQPETANNAVNALKEDYGEGDYFVYRWLSNTAQWGCLTTAENDFKIRVAMKPTTEKGHNGENQTDWISLTTLFSIGANDPRHIFWNFQ